MSKTKRWTGSLAAAALTGASLSLGGPAVAATAPGTPSGLAAGTTAVSETSDSGTRNRFGLDSSESAIAAAQRDGLRPDLLGVPLTESEVARVLEQEQVVAALGQFEQSMQLVPGFASTDFARIEGDVAVLKVATDDDAVLVGQLRRVLPKGTKLRVERVQYDKITLTRQQAQATALVSELADRGFANIDHAANRVVVEVPAETTQAVIDNLARALPFASVRNATLFQTEATRWDTGGHPVYGGSLVRARSRLGVECTAGVSFTNSGQRYIFTAGHCGDDSYVWGSDVNDTQNVNLTRAIGQSVGNRFVNGATIVCDCLGIRVIDNNIGFTSSRVFVGGARAVTQPAPFNYTRTATAGDYFRGRSVCQSGDASGLQCGVILEPDTTQTEAFGTTRVNLRGATVDYPSQAGDSGGPVGDGGTWMGIHAAAVNGVRLMSRSDYGLANFQGVVDYSR